jgi:hypothetical protein
MTDDHKKNKSWPQKNFTQKWDVSITEKQKYLYMGCPKPKVPLVFNEIKKLFFFSIFQIFVLYFHEDFIPKSQKNCMSSKPHPFLAPQYSIFNFFAQYWKF